MSKKNYYAVVDKKSGKVNAMTYYVDINVKRKHAESTMRDSERIVVIPIDALNAFIQRYIPVKPVDQIPGN